VGIGKDGAVRRQLRTLFNVGAVRELTDGQLLERFATDRGEAAELAFAVLVERHGSMVMRVCRGVLADSHAAQDAFQATFLVLVKRARGLWVRDSIGPWLHQVAHRTATCARTTAARHRRLERRAAVSVEEARPERDFELERLLHEEIDRLPDRFRSPVVLCDLEGRTYEQAARHLGWPVGSVKSRLARGRERLRARLIRRGVASELGPIAVVGAFKIPAVSVPPALLEVTTSAAVRFAAIGPAVRGSAATLAEGVLRTMTMTQWWKVATVLVVAGATASGVEWVGAGGGPGAQVPAASKDQAANAGDAPTREVKSGKLELVVNGRGSVEAGRAEAVYSNVEGQTTIIKIAPEGRRVKRGDVIAELDSAALKDQLINQRITTRSAEANFLNAKLTREVAEIAVMEYKDVFKQEQDELRRAIEGGRAAIRKIEGRLERTRAASRRLKDLMRAGGGARTPAEVVADVDIQDRIEDAELDLDRERRSLAQAEGKWEILHKYTSPKTVKELEGEAVKARSNELAKQATWELEKSKEAKLEKMIGRCTLVAPIDGIVVHANDPARLRPGAPQIEEGATVRERQIIARIVDTDGPMQINLKVAEASVKVLARKMKARVKIDAFADESLDGEVINIAPLPDAGTFFSSDLKVYTTRIRLGGRAAHLRPGMTASAEIVTDERDDAIGVPYGALIAYDGKYNVALKRPDGRIEWRDVVLGAAGDEIVEIKEGLRDGDQVILDPQPFLTDDQRARIDAAPAAASKKAAAPAKARAKPARSPR
jgi:RND family efflux transporter MFP subunit